MAEIVGDAKGAILAFSILGNMLTLRASVASTAISKELAQLASVKTPTQIEQTRVGL
jgi:hypothetical protein